MSEPIPPQSGAEALAEARRHARHAAAELAAALRALLDAATFAAHGAPAADGRLAPLAEALDALARWLHPEADARDAEAIVRALSEGLDAEIARWEARSRDDPEARSVLRAFLAVREVLWELGTRFGTTPADSGPGGARGDGPERPARRRRSRRRVQRVAVEG